MTDASTKTRPRKARIIIWAIIAAAIMAMILTVVIANVVNNNRQQTLVGDGPQLTRETAATYPRLTTKRPYWLSSWTSNAKPASQLNPS